MAAEVTHEALFEHWTTLKDWIDDNREDLRFHRRLTDAVNHWDKQKRPDGLLWRSPDLEQLQQFHERARQDMTQTQIEFYNSSIRKEKL